MEDKEKEMERILIEGLIFGPSKAIELQEKRGQDQVVKEVLLPKKFNPYEREFRGKEKNIFKKLGIKIINEVDDLFYSVKLPLGWKIEPTSHSMWNKVLDDKGRCRMKFFYKAAFYDRDAFINLDTRYSIDFEYQGDEEFYMVKDGEDIIIEATKDRQLCQDFLDKNYPDWKNPLKYWED